jgi:hypothetical protein
MRMTLQGSAESGIHENSCEPQQKAENGHERLYRLKSSASRAMRQSRKSGRIHRVIFGMRNYGLARLWMKWPMCRAAWQIVIDGLSPCDSHHIVSFQILRILSAESLGVWGYWIEPLSPTRVGHFIHAIFCH